LKKEEEEAGAKLPLPLFSSANSKLETRNSKLPASCVYQIDKLCSIHTIRPMGCRVFFCQEGTSEWQHELYESFLTRLRTLHDELKIPYRYMEWRAGLRDARLLAPSPFERGLG
jgi:Fe-S-cluster containining protein